MDTFVYAQATTNWPHVHWNRSETQYHSYILRRSLQSKTICQLWEELCCWTIPNESDKSQGEICFELEIRVKFNAVAIWLSCLFRTNLLHLFVLDPFFLFRLNIFVLIVSNWKPTKRILNNWLLYHFILVLEFFEIKKLVRLLWAGRQQP